MQNNFLRNIVIFIFWWVSILFVLTPLIIFIFESSEFSIDNYIGSFFEFNQRTFILSFICSLPFFIYKYIVLLISVLQKKLSFKESFNKAWKYFAGLVLYISILLLIDIHVLRGFVVLSDLHRGDKNYEPGQIDMSYKIEKNRENWHLTIKNESIHYYYLLNYRSEEAYPEYIYDDSLVFKYFASRLKTYVDSMKIECSSGFDCGTGLGSILILPFEEFSYEFENIYNVFHVDFIDYWELTKNNSPIDSIDIQFYIPVYKIGSGYPAKIYSNPIRINYKEMMAKQTIKFKDDILFMQSVPRTQK